MKKGEPTHIVASFSPYLKDVFQAMKNQFPNVKQEFITPKTPEHEKYAIVKNAIYLLGDFQQINQIDRETIKAAQNLKLIQQPTVGIDAIDIEAATEYNIPVANTAGFNSVAVAEHTMMLILASLKKLKKLNQETCDCNWLQVQMVNSGEVGDLENKTLGILGFGQAGRELAKRAQAFSTNIIYNKRNRLSLAEEDELNIKYTSFEEILQQSDILSVHVPLTDETRGMIGENEIASMKKGAILVNVARGEVVDAHALADAIKSGHLSGAGVDVFDPEPISVDNPLIGLENVILTPHVAGATGGAKANGVRICFQNLMRVLDGETPINVVNNR